jgi:hypothetical protein
MTRLLLGARYALGLLLTAHKVASELGPARSLGHGSAAEELAQRAGSRGPGWWLEYSDMLPSWFSSYIRLEDAASRIRSYETQYVPGLLQTEGYARAITTRAPHGPNTKEIERKLSVRLARQHLLLAAHPPRLWVVVDEPVLRRQIGSRAIMRDQLRYLIELAAQPYITLQVIPFRAHSHLMAGGSFTILRYEKPDLPDVVYIEHLTSAILMDQREHVDRYAQVMDQLGVIAAPSNRTIEILSRIYDDL